METTARLTSVAATLSLKDYDFDYPESLVALRPLDVPSDARLLVYDRKARARTHTQFKHLADFLSPKDLLVFNQSPVRPSRIHAKKTTGGVIEILYLGKGSREDLTHVWLHGRVKAGDLLVISLDSKRADEAKVWTLKVHSRVERSAELSISPKDFEAILKDLGLPAIPPYIRYLRRKEWGCEDWELDRTRYQSLLAKLDSEGGSAAAPTASLHFDTPLLNSLKEKGISWATCELDVGEGTFAPLSEEQLRQSRLHAERVRISEELIQQMGETKARGGRLVAVGTTTLRALESAALRTGHGSKVQDFSTDLFIHPEKEFSFQCVDALITNFHLPQSSLILLIARFLEPNTQPITHVWREIYKEAIQKEYRLFSYGDGMLIL